MKLSVAVTIYNEEQSIPELIQRLKNVCKNFAPYEIICVNDASTDNSLEILKQEQKNCPELKIINFKENGGKSEGLAACFREANGEIVVTIDADLQESPEEIPDLIAELNDVELVNGWRYKRQDSFLTRIASAFANNFRNLILKDNAHDTGCPLKAFKRSALDDIPLFKGMHRFLPALVLMNGGKVKEVKISHHKRAHGRSKTRTFSRAVPAFFDLLAVAWMRKRKLDFKIKEVV